MALSRPAKRTELKRGTGTVVFIEKNEEFYPQDHREQMPVQCPMENCNWIGEADTYEDHKKMKHSPYLVEPAEYTKATHMVVSKDQVETVVLVQDEVEKLQQRISHERVVLKEVLNTVQKTCEELEKDEDQLKTQTDQLRTLHSQVSRNADPVILQRNGVPIQHNGGANSTASLGRANQLLPPPQERCSTLDAKGPDFQHFQDDYDQGDDHVMDYAEPQPQTDQSLGIEALLVGNTPHIGGGIAVHSGYDHPPPLPPKSKQYIDNGISLQQESNMPPPSSDISPLSSDMPPLPSDMPPPLPPKPNTNPPPLPPREFRKCSLTGAEQNGTVPPPRPPKPGHLLNAKAAVPVRRARRSSPSTPSSTKSAHGLKDTDVGYAVIGCPNCAQLQKKNDKLKSIIQKQFLSKHSSTCPQSVCRSDWLQLQQRHPTM